MSEFLETLTSELVAARSAVPLVAGLYGMYFKLTRVPFDVEIKRDVSWYVTYKNTSNRMVPRKAHDLQVRVLDDRKRELASLDYENQAFDAGDEDVTRLPQSAVPPVTIKITYRCWRWFRRSRRWVLEGEDD